MKPRNREINIFNLSMMDVIAGALGAFLILFLLLQPYYGKTSKAPPSPPAKNMREAQQQIEDLRARVQQQQKQLEMTNRVTFAVGKQWRAVDLDLWVYDVTRKQWNGPKGKQLPGSIQPDWAFYDMRENENSFAEMYTVMVRPEGLYLVALHWHSGKLPAEASPPLIAPFGFFRATPAPLSIAKLDFTYLERPGTLKIVAAARVTPEDVVTLSINETWSGGPFPPATNQALALLQKEYP